MRLTKETPEVKEPTWKCGDYFITDGGELRQIVDRLSGDGSTSLAVINAKRGHVTWGDKANFKNADNLIKNYLTVSYVKKIQKIKITEIKYEEVNSYDGK